MGYRYFLICFLLVFLSGIWCAATPEDTRTLVITGEGLSADTKNDTSVQDLVDLVNEAMVYTQRVGKEAALKEFSDRNGSFSRGDMYVWAYDFNGINLAHPFHPEYAGENKLMLNDSAGFPMIRAMQEIAQNGSGFVTYQYENPLTGITGPKLSYVKRVDDTWWLGSGIYGELISIPANIPESIRDTLQAKVDKAVSYAREFGKDKALSEFNDKNGRFTANNTYIFAFDTDGTTLAMPFHPEKVGTNEKNLTDENGVSIGGEKLMVAREGGGFLYYVFDNPAAGNKSEFKVSCIRLVDDTWVIGTGMYLPEIPVNFSADERKNLVAQVRKAVAYVTEQGREKAIREFNDLNGTFSNPKMFIYAFDTNGTMVANPYLPGLVGMNRMNDRHSLGKYQGRQLVENAKNGGGFTYYFFADPGSDYAVRLKLGYSEMADDNLIIGAGIFTVK
jgi:polar amino acid transport system substrate-binding protein